VPEVRPVHRDRLAVLEHPAPPRLPGQPAAGRGRCGGGGINPIVTLTKQLLNMIVKLE
jgi:hypothetical protein